MVAEGQEKRRLRGTRRKPRPSQLAALGILVGGLCAAFTAARSIPFQVDLVALALAFSPYVIVGYLVAVAALVASLAGGRTVVRLVASALVVSLAVVHVSWMVPRYVRDDRALATGTISVLAVNVWVGNADTARLDRAAEDADIVVLTEVTRSALKRLDQLGWSTRYPHRTPGPLPTGGTAGTVILSRFPMTASEPFAPDISNQAWTATLAVPDVGEIRVVAVHPTRPYLTGSRWASQQRLLRDSLLALRRGGGGPIVVAGDFNAVADHYWLHRLRSDGFRSAGDIAGAGWLPTYPAAGWIPPLLGIDHILLTNDLTATSATTERIAGTNHRAVRAVIGGVQPAPHTG